MITTFSAPRAWDARSLEARDTWRVRVPGEVVEDFAEYWCSVADRDPETATFDSARTPKLAAFAASVRKTLMVGDGLCWIRGLGASGLDAGDRPAFYAALGCSLGEPMLQYGRLYQIKDRGGSYRESSIPVSQTSAETGYHTDSSAREVLPDFVGLLCEQPSTNGGESLVSNALHAHRILQDHAPDSLAILYRNFVRDIVTPGVESTPDNLQQNSFPIFTRDRTETRIEFRYMRYWIERGQMKAGAPLHEEERAALDLLDEVLGAREHRVRFQLEAGDIVWINNCALAHNRSAYTDAPGNTRRLVRMWIRARSRTPDARIRDVA